MLKRDELSDPNSCLNKANDDEFVFVLLERDPATPAAIKRWIKKRLKLLLNIPEDEKIQSAKKLVKNLKFKNKSKHFIKEL